MDNLKKTLNDFLSDQEERLSKRTYKDYRNVIQLLEDYLNGYAYMSLSKEEQEKFEKQAIFGEESYCEMYSVDRISSTEFNEFLTYFMIRKVLAEKYLMKKTVTVLRRFTKWLKNNNYIDEEKFSDIYSAINKVKDLLPKVAELSNLIYDESQKNEYNNYSSYVEGNYVITKVKSGKLWFKDYMNNKDEIGPVIVSKKITDLAVEDLFVYCVSRKLH